MLRRLRDLVNDSVDRDSVLRVFCIFDDFVGSILLLD